MEVVKFRKFGDYEKVDYFAGEAAAVHGHLENIHDKAVELNEREINLDSSPTEFMDLERIMRDFSPWVRNAIICIRSCHNQCIINFRQ